MGVSGGPAAVNWEGYPRQGRLLGIGQEQHRSRHLLGGDELLDECVPRNPLSASSTVTPLCSANVRAACSTMGVMTAPGHTALTVMWSPASSAASALVSPTTPCFEAQ